MGVDDEAAVDGGAEIGRVGLPLESPLMPENGKSVSVSARRTNRALHHLIWVVC